MRVLLSVLLLAHALPVQAAQKKSAPTKPREGGVFAILAEIDRISVNASLWEGFDPRRVPVEIFYGSTTYLFRHPNPPPEFVSLSSHRGVYAFPGRHETVTANAPAKLNGVLTATAMIAPGAKRPLRELAALVVHEAFHVFQREHHPDWSGNEVELFVYPFEDAGGLSLRRLESLALVRAERAQARGESACWAAAAIRLRRERFARLTAGAAAYERGTELNEGLATYVEARAAGRATRSRLTADEFGAEAIRQRAYESGLSLAILLDRFAPGWQRRLEAGDKRSLDELLEAALSNSSTTNSRAADSRSAGRIAPCEFNAGGREAASSRARSETGSLVARRVAARRDFLARPGWRLVVEAVEGAPLFPQGFDPLNVSRVGASEILHTRFLKLGNAAGSVEILSRGSLTEGAGRHPLFNGVRRLTVAGLPSEPTVKTEGERVRIDAQGLKGEFRGARVSRDAQTLTVRLRK
ncbi:MAG: hypothetical protein LC785_15835 [Acidobacteria bacterium]|nr:hypothetical protein [Acidobacteriota bacterium]MCA1643376.1 hypothetical protein [Acidobacteriota bacterium]